MLWHHAGGPHPISHLDFDFSQKRQSVASKQLRVLQPYDTRAPRRELLLTVTHVFGPAFPQQIRTRSFVATTDQAISGVPGRYASALFELASESKAIAETAKALSAFQGLLDGSTDLQRLLRSPVFKAEAQLEAINTLAAKAKINGLAADFLRVMCGNRRLAAVPAAIQAFHALVARDKGEISATVTSAEKLGTKHIADLKAALKAVLGHDVVLQTKTDPSILGGLIVTVGSRMMDNSLLTKLNRLKTAMKGNA
jgi:F-type H+-transporting ATPase subunit delta